MTERYRPRRPRARRRWVWVLAGLLATVVGLSAAVGNLGTRAREQTAFFDMARVSAGQVDQIAEGFRRLVSNELRTINRDDFVALMDRLSAEMMVEAQEFREVPVPERVSSVRDLLELAFTSWEEGLVEFRDAVTDVTDDPSGSVPVDRLGGAIARIRVGDLVYESYLARADDLIEEMGITNSMPDISFIIDQRPLLNGERLARTIRSSTAMGVRRDVAILQVVFEPLPAGGLGQEGEILFPATERLQFSAVVGNRGNVEQKGLLVTAGIRSEGGETLSSVDSPALDLAPGEIGSVLFGTEVVEPGAEYLLTFKVTVVEDELDTSNNVWESPIRINPRG